MINRKTFFNAVRTSLFKGKLKVSQVEGIEGILSKWEHDKYTDLRWLAYMLATVYWETAQTMQPIEEYGKGRGRIYGKADLETGQIYYGRGFVQLTWKYNYLAMSKVVGVDLVKHPEKALDLHIATTILFHGMIHGSFTGRKLEHYFNYKPDWYNARRIINGIDKAETIATIAKKFYISLL